MEVLLSGPKKRIYWDKKGEGKKETESFSKI